MPKKVKGLTAAKVKSITKSGDYADGNGLIKTSQHNQWSFKSFNFIVYIFKIDSQIL